MHVICFNMFTPILCNLTSSGPLLPNNTPIPLFMFIKEPLSLIGVVK